MIDKFNIDTILRHLHIVEGQVIFSGGCEGLKSNPPKNYKPFRHTRSYEVTPPIFTDYCEADQSDAELVEGVS